MGMAGGAPMGMGGMGMGGMGINGMMNGKRPFTSDVRCTLEELYLGTTKKLKITRQCQSPSRPREHVFEVQVRPCRRTRPRAVPRAGSCVRGEEAPASTRGGGSRRRVPEAGPGGGSRRR